MDALRPDLSSASLMPINATPACEKVLGIFMPWLSVKDSCLGTNLQVRKMKRKNCEYDYVEVMACPSGCLNGGGQLKAGQGQSQQQLLDQLDAIYHDPEARSLSVLIGLDIPRLGSNKPAAGCRSARCHTDQRKGLSFSAEYCLEYVFH